MKLKKIEFKELVDKYDEVDKLQELLIKNNDKEGIHGDGKGIIEVKEIPVKHTFADGIYVRQMDMSKGQVVIGAIHNHLHLWFLLKGRLLINDNGEKIEYIAPCYTVSKPGARRAVYALEDSIFVNIHKNPTNEKDIKKLEKELVSVTKKEFDKQLKQ
jgi:quercetin dioxygenase-like cupin family protein